ncbi:hypothetical protein Barb6_02450 [Bacteroidales bacterium Barb6]|nr:hypothetical protein Barb6_02450 [Bacteroidales bacterium Barb6]
MVEEGSQEMAFSFVTVQQGFSRFAVIQCTQSRIGTEYTFITGFPKRTVCIRAYGHQVIQRCKSLVIMTAAPETFIGG